jgi:NitT/TauT family transport system substrate-binding protein
VAVVPNAGAAPPGPLAKVRAAHAVVSSGMAPLWLAADEGLWQQHGLDVEITLISGTPVITAALLANEIQFAQTAAEAAFAVQARNPDVVSFLNASGPSQHRFMVAPSIQRVEDLRGKRFGVFTIGDGNYALLSKAMPALGLNPETDAVWTAVGGGNMAGLVQALTMGAIDLALLTPPNDLMAARNGAHELLRLRDLNLPSAGLPVFTMRRMLDEQRPVVTAFAKGMVDAIRLYRADPAAAKRSLAGHLSMSEPELVDYIYETLADEGIKARPIPDVAQARAVLDMLIAEQPELREVRLDRSLDTSVLDELDRQGYLPPR